ncbi:MAG: magnesium/cobalt transporter CorA [Asgard group archaeon]|nr:magnesium/cobalt transporter CorA [Asgard group archaeon]
MTRLFKDREANKGLAPGSLVFIGEKKLENVRIRIIDFDKDNLVEQELKDIMQVRNSKDTNTVTWINIDGLHDLDLIHKVGETFDLHPLLLEDILNTGQRPKMEEFDNCIYIILKMLQYDDKEKVIHSEQLSMIISRTFLITFQERVGDVFEPVRERIRKQKGRIRKAGIDYLAYALLDTVVDNYLYLISGFGEKIEDIEVGILGDNSTKTLEKINTYKREMSYIRKSIRPTMDFVSKLSKLESEFIRAETKPFLNDLLDLITHATESIDMYREMLSDQLNIYNSNVSQKMNDVMKILTIFAAIFIPLTFIAGIYGTNFEYLPELHFKYSYFVFWGVIITVAISMLLFFKRKDWL